MGFQLYYTTRMRSCWQNSMNCMARPVELLRKISSERMYRVHEDARFESYN
ncbi:MAG: hypothetical protein KZQ63_12095 [Candidatus Thiodiazotropha sp. (ex Lucinoma aequizonata)]|nr:hypothetical protein [Candidatus Thiodiazotropha sp. (ex Lucinoma aequizonata)]